MWVRRLASFSSKFGLRNHLLLAILLPESEPNFHQSSRLRSGCRCGIHISWWLRNLHWNQGLLRQIKINCILLKVVIQKPLATFASHRLHTDIFWIFSAGAIPSKLSQDRPILSSCLSAAHYWSVGMYMSDGREQYPAEFFAFAHHCLDVDHHVTKRQFYLSFALLTMTYSNAPQ